MKAGKAAKASIKADMAAKASVKTDTPAPTRVVFDTNVVLSALVFSDGVMGRIRRSWQSGSVTPLTCTPTASELIRALSYPKFSLTEAEQRELLSDFLPWCEVVALPSPLPKVPAYRDRHDVPFLHLAVAGKAHLLVTGDAHLLALDAKVPFSIVMPADFRATHAS